MKRMFALSALLLVALAPAAWASNPQHPDGCHGANEVPCRPDPQPTHGADCTRSDDHSCSSTTSAPSTTSTSSPAPSGTTTTTVTTEAGGDGSPLTMTTSSPPTTATTQPASPYTTSTLTRACDSIQLCPPAAAVTELAHTGAGTDILVGLGLWCLVSGGAALLVAQLMRGAR